MLLVAGSVLVLTAIEEMAVQRSLTHSLAKHTARTVY